MAVDVRGLTMRAVVARGPIPPSGLRVEEVDWPAIPDDGVLVRVHASSVNPVDLYALTPVAHVQRGLKPRVVGTDFAGTVESVGSRVTRFQPGDEVFGGARGAFAERTCALERHVAPKPPGVSFADAATLAVAGSTALQAVRNHGRIQAGQRVLINGASGGVGTFAVQIARSLGGEVTAVCSTANVEMVRSLGAHRVIDYTKEDFVEGVESYDLMLDVAGNRGWSDCMRVLNAGGTYVAVGAAGVQHARGGSWRALGHFLDIRLRSIRSGRKLALFIANLNQADLTTLGDLLATGEVKPVIERRYDLASVSDAMTYLAEGHARGKVGIDVG
jgi:NADPH:quinone reductase-like Zn-dependent oxidoreductase